MVLQGNVAFKRPVLNWSRLVYIHDLLSVEVHLEVVKALTGDNHLVPLTGLLGHILGGADSADNSTVVMGGHLVVGLAIGV